MHRPRNDKTSPKTNEAKTCVAGNITCLSQLISPSELSNLSEIAQGTFATVYKGTWHSKKIAVKKIAVKKINSGFTDVDNEINIMTVLTHLDAPHCVKLHGYFYAAYTYSLVMEYMPNGSLANMIDHGRSPLNWQFSVDVMRNISSAVAFMHQHDIVHRDIKSENIIFDENMQAKLCDFGLSKFIDAQVEFAGTIEYLAPEIRFQPYSFKADVFSLSVTLWEAVARSRPYLDLSLNQCSIYNQVYNGYREPVPENCPPRLGHLITWGWAKNPRHRPTAKQFLAELNKKDIIKTEISLLSCFKRK